MDDYLRDMTAIETILLDAFQNNDQLGDDAHIADTFFESLKIFFHHPSLWTWRSVKVYPVGDNDVTIQLERKFWLVKCMFLRNFEVSYHKVLPYINLRNIISTQWTLQMVNFMNVNNYISINVHLLIYFSMITNYRLFKDKVLPSDNVFSGSCKEVKKF